MQGGGEGASPYQGRGGKKGLIFTGVNQACDVELGPYFFVVPKNKLAGIDLCTPYYSLMPSLYMPMLILTGLHASRHEISSFGGTCIRLAGGTIAHKCKFHPTVAGSSTEAEFMAANDTGKMILFV